MWSPRVIGCAESTALMAPAMVFSQARPDARDGGTTQFEFSLPRS